MRRRRVAGALAMVALVLLAAPLRTAAATATGTSAVTIEARAGRQADEGMRLEATTTYTVDAAAGVVRVVVEASVLNTEPDRREGDIIYQRYYTGFSFGVPAGAANFAATSEGRALPVTSTAIEGVDEITRLEVEFADRLYYEESMALVVTFDLTGQAPRTGGFSRINAAYASFAVYGVGDPGLTNVRVVVPTVYELDTLGERAIESTEGDSRVLTATGVGDEWFMVVSARNDAALVPTPGVTGDVDFTVQSWPGDDEWRQFVTTTVTDGVPALANLIGQPWPIHESLVVREAFTPYLYGYAGWFNAATGVIDVGEDLDLEVVLHELSHAWFNTNLFRDRWINEGMAQTYAAFAQEALGTPPEAPEPIDSELPGYVTLLAGTRRRSARTKPVACERNTATTRRGSSSTPWPTRSALTACATSSPPPTPA